jgi:multidrug efflux pump subunit AcrA (membrane-fusion protein)
VTVIRRFSTLLVTWLAVAGAPTATAAQTLDCLVNPFIVVAVSFPTDGVLDSVAVDRGDLVKEGQVLATLESTLEKATVALASARAKVESALKANQVRLDFGVRKFARTDEMYQKNLVPLKELDEAETQKVLADLGILEAKENRQIAELELERAHAALG